jgi:hypothetical protein
MPTTLTAQEKRWLAALDRSAIRARDEQNTMRGLVGMLRENGVPWEMIAQCLGVTKQAAQQRFSA